MTFREDVYSLLYVSIVKPQYKMYCDIVARTGEKRPFDLHRPIPSIHVVDASASAVEFDTSGLKNWHKRLASYVCCRRPEFDENGDATFTSKALILDVISSPTKFKQKPLTQQEAMDKFNTSENESEVLDGESSNQEDNTGD